MNKTAKILLSIAGITAGATALIFAPEIYGYVTNRFQLWKEDKKGKQIDKTNKTDHSDISITINGQGIN